GEREQLLEGGASQPRLQPGEGGGGDAGPLGEFGQRDVPVLAQPLEAGAHGFESAVDIVFHAHILPFSKIDCQVGDGCLHSTSSERSRRELDMSTENELRDAVVVGGGAAGLGAALTLARA